ncbi:CinA family protein, partial [bacterium]|nr:CinA family protein [bacterium]
DTPGASNFFCGSAIAYLNRVKVELGVRETTINQFGVVSKEVAVEMAHCARETFRCDWGISTTGVAGPADVDGIPVGTAYIAIEGPSGIFSKEISWPGERRQIKERVANSALMLLFKTLKKSDK